jgi:hypothetical protein
MDLAGTREVPAEYLPATSPRRRAGTQGSARCLALVLGRRHEMRPASALGRIMNGTITPCAHFLTAPSGTAGAVGNRQQNGCVSNPELVKALDLDRWCEDTDSKLLLPVMVRQLVLATAPVTEIRMDGREGVMRHGWMGRHRALPSRGPAPEPRLRFASRGIRRVPTKCLARISQVRGRYAHAGIEPGLYRAGASRYSLGSLALRVVARELAAVCFGPVWVGSFELSVRGGNGHCVGGDGSSRACAGNGD